MSMIVFKVFFLLFTSVLKLHLLKTVMFWLGPTLSVLKKLLDKTLKFFSTKFGAQRKDQKSSYQLRQSLALFAI